MHAAGGGNTREEARTLAAVLACVGAAVTSASGKHPGIVSEAVVEAVTAAFTLTPRDTHYAERRRNHPERVRRLAHEVFRILEAEPDDRIAARRIGEGVLRSFAIAPRGDGGPPSGAGA